MTAGAKQRPGLKTCDAAQLITSLAERCESTFDEHDLVALTAMQEEAVNLVERVASISQTIAFLVVGDDHAGHTGAFNGRHGGLALNLIGDQAAVAEACLRLAMDADTKLQRLRAGHG